MHDAFVYLVIASIELRQPRGPPDYQGKNAGRRGIEGSQMSDLARSRQPPHLIDDVMRGPIARLIDYDYSVHSNNFTSRA